MNRPQPDREGTIVRAFVELSNDLVDDYDLVELLSRLATSCADLLDIDSAGLLLADASGVLHLAAASSERTRQLELFQLQRDEGPCLDAYHGHEPVLVPDVAASAQRWPQFADAAVEAGYASVHALPMSLRGRVLGALGLFGTSTGQLGEDDVRLAQALVHVAGVAIVNDEVSADRDLVNAQLQKALASRVVVEQAKGVLSHAGGTGMDEAFAALRSYARDHRVRLSDVAARIVARDLSGHDVIAHNDARRDHAALPASRPDAR